MKLYVIRVQAVVQGENIVIRLHEGLARIGQDCGHVGRPHPTVLRETSDGAIHTIVIKRRWIPGWDTQNSYSQICADFDNRT